MSRGPPSVRNPGMELNFDVLSVVVAHVEDESTLSSCALSGRRMSLIVARVRRAAFPCLEARLRSQPTVRFDDQYKEWRDSQPGTPRCALVYMSNGMIRSWKERLFSIASDELAVLRPFRTGVSLDPVRRIPWLGSSVEDGPSPMPTELKVVDTPPGGRFRGCEFVIAVQQIPARRGPIYLSLPSPEARDALLRLLRFRRNEFCRIGPFAPLFLTADHSR